MTDREFAKRWARGLGLASAIGWGHVRQACVSPRLFDALTDVFGASFIFNRYVWVRTGEGCGVDVYPETSIGWEGDSLKMFPAEWRTPTVVGLCKTARREPEILPILADALEDAGCDWQEVLDVCRSNIPKAKGIIAVILGHQPFVIPFERITPNVIMGYLETECDLTQSVRLMKGVWDVRLTQFHAVARREVIFTLGVIFSDDRDRWQRLQGSIREIDLVMGKPWSWREIATTMANEFTRKVLALRDARPEERLSLSESL